MTEQNKENANIPNEGADQVVLSKEQYSLVYDTLEKLEKDNEALREAIAKKGGDDDIDDLAAEGKKVNPILDKDSLPDFDKLSNQQLAMFIGETIHSKMIVPLVTEIQALRIENQIKELISDPKKEASDFYDYKKEIFDILSKSPNLNVEEAYYLAKHGKGGAKPKDNENDGGKTKGLFNILPKRPVGEKPGAPGGGTTPEANTREDAAKMALEKLQKEGLLPKG